MTAAYALTLAGATFYHALRNRTATIRDNARRAHIRNRRYDVLH